MVEIKQVAYSDGDTALHGFLACDREISGRCPGILVVHGGAGLDDHARGRALRLAEWGFVVFACDMYGEGVAGNRERVISCITDLRRDRAKLCRRALHGLDVLKSHESVDGRFAAVGYCFGGTTVLELARSGAKLAGVVSIHGSLETVLPAEPAAIQSKILVCHGGLDPHVPMTHVTAFAEEMIRAGADWQLFVYGGAMHGFTHETATGQQPGVAYHALSDARSSRAVQTFFRELFA
jgi:dienelactone hydrolase